MGNDKASLLILTTTEKLNHITMATEDGWEERYP